MVIIAIQLHESRIFYPSGHWPETVQWNFNENEIDFIDEIDFIEETVFENIICKFSLDFFFKYWRNKMDS